MHLGITKSLATPRGGEVRFVLEGINLAPCCAAGCSASHKCSLCIKTYSHRELDEMLAPFGFRRVSYYYRRHAVAALYQRCNA